MEIQAHTLPHRIGHPARIETLSEAFLDGFENNLGVFLEIPFPLYYIRRKKKTVTFYVNQRIYFRSQSCQSYGTKGF